MRTAVVLVSLAGVFGAVSLGSPREAQAQTVNAVTPTGKGIAGCALLGDAFESGAEGRPPSEKVLTRARSAVDKATHLLASLESS